MTVAAHPLNPTVALVLRRAAVYAFEHGAHEAVEMAVIDYSGGPQDNTRLGRVLPATGTQAFWSALYGRTHDVLNVLVTDAWTNVSHQRARDVFLKAAELCAG